MRGSFIGIGALLLAVCLPVPVAAAGALEIELRAPVPPALNRPVQLAVALRNGGETTLVLPNGAVWATPHGLSLQVAHAGHPTRTVVSGPRPASETLPLAPGHAADVSRTLAASEVFFAGAGEYVLTVTYTGPDGAVSSTPLPAR